MGPALVIQWLRLHLPIQGLQVQFLGGELRSHMAWGQKKTKHKTEAVLWQIQTRFFKWSAFKNNLKKNNEKAVGKSDVTLWILPVGESSRSRGVYRQCLVDLHLPLRASQMVLVVKDPLANAGDTGWIPWRKEWQPSLVILAWETPWTEEPGRL